MPARITENGTSRQGPQHVNCADQDREPPLCWRELMMLTMDGMLPSEQRLEHLLDRIERPS